MNPTSFAQKAPFQKAPWGQRGSVMNDCDEGRIYECDQCELKTFSYSYLRTHITNKHDYEGRVFNCDKCNKSYSYEWNLEIHKRNTHNPVEAPCQYCDFIARHKQNLAYHMKVKHKENINLKKCNKCSFSTLADCALKRHEIRKHTNQFLKCQYSDCTFDTLFEDKMSKHLISYHMNKKCSYCDIDIQSKKPGDLLMHKYKNHYNEMKIICLKCSFKTLSKVQLSIHSFMKHGETIICSYCQDKVDSIAKLKEHLKSKHRKFYSCNKCDFFDARIFLLDIHKKEQHPIEPNRKNKKAFDERSTKITTKAHIRKRKNRCKRCGLEFDHGWTLFHHKNKCTMIDLRSKNNNKGESQSTENTSLNGPSEDSSEIYKGDNNTRSDNDNESEDILSKLKESLKNEISFLNETFPAEDTKGNNKSQEYFELSNENDQTGDVIKEEQLNPLEEQNFDTETQDPLFNQSFSDEKDGDNLTYFVCPLDSCTFLTSVLTDKIISEHFREEHPDNDQPVKTVFLPL